MKKHLKYLVILISFCTLAMLPNMEIKAAESQKELQANSSSNLNYTFTTINDATVSTTSSKTTVLIFGRIGCPNTRL